MAQAKPSNKQKELKNFTKNHKQLTSIRNKGTNRQKIIDSGRRLPSAKGHIRLAAMVEEAHNWLREVEKQYKDRAQILEKKLKLKKTYRNHPERLAEIPNNYLLDHKYQELCQELKTATALYDDLQAAHKRATGHKWKPQVSEEFHKPLEF